MAFVLSTGHVGLNVTNLERSRDFYVNVLGFEVGRESTDGEKKFAFLTQNGTLMVTLWEQSAVPFDSGSAGLHHLAFLVPSIERVREIEANIRAAGVKLYHDGIVPHAENQNSRGVFFEDPDGTRLEVYTESGAETAHAPFGSAPTCGFF